MAKFELKSYRPYRLVLGDTGRHRFGGPAKHRGATPAGTKTPLHLVLSLDLSDPNCPIGTKSAIHWLPLYYPLKYGTGGPEVQYSVLSDTRIQILHMSDDKPDDEEWQYVQVASLPDSKAEIIPLEYEEARILGLRVADEYFEPNPRDAKILRRLFGPTWSRWLRMGGDFIAIGGLQIGVRHAQDVICRNEKCEFFRRSVHFEVIAAIPPIAVRGSDEFWYEFQGGRMQFCFGLCHYCGTVIAFNRAS